MYHKNYFVIRNLYEINLPEWINDIYLYLTKYNIKKVKAIIDPKSIFLSCSV